jgi:hypothetical protein
MNFANILNLTMLVLKIQAPVAEANSRAAQPPPLSCEDNFRFLSRIPIHKSLPTRPFESMFGDLHELHLGMIDYKATNGLKVSGKNRKVEQSTIFLNEGAEKKLTAIGIHDKNGRQTPWHLHEFEPIIKGSSANTKNGVILKVKGNTERATIQLKLQSGHDTLSIPIDVPPAKNPGEIQEIFVPINKLKLKRENSTLKNSAKVDVEVNLKKGDQVEIVGPILFHRDPRDPAWREEIVKIISRGYDVGKHRRLVKTIVDQLFNEKAQAYALKTLKDPKTVNEFLRRTGSSTILLKGKVESTGRGAFFGSFSKVPWKAIPIETGKFGKEHGEFG